MSYAEALERLKSFQDGPDTVLTKPTEGAFVSSGSADPGPFEKSGLDSGSNAACQLRHENAAGSSNDISNTPAPGTDKTDERMPELFDLMPVCRQACRDKYIDARDLAGWLIDQGDPEWCAPYCIKWWASYIERHGWPED